MRCSRGPMPSAPQTSPAMDMERRSPAPEAHGEPAPVAVSPAPAADADTARTAGRGGLAIAVAKVSFICFGFAQQIILPRLVGVDGYGEVSRVLAIVGIVNNVIV